MPARKQERLPARTALPYAEQPHKALTPEAKVIAALDAMGFAPAEIREATGCGAKQVSVLRSREDYLEERTRWTDQIVARIEPMTVAIKAKIALVMEEALAVNREALRAVLPETDSPNWAVRIPAIKLIYELGGKALLQTEMAAAQAGAAASATLVVHMNDDGSAEIIEAETEEVDTDGRDREGD